MSQLRIHTIGYQGLNLDDYITALERSGINVLLDVREVPWSRKAGFSKSTLSATLAEHGIEYIHVKSAGNPGAIRKAAQSMEECLSNYRSYLLRNPAGVQAVLEFIKGDAYKGKRICMTCFEHDPEQCHRSIIVDRLLAIHENLVVVHLQPCASPKRSKVSPSLTI